MNNNIRLENIPDSGCYILYIRLRQKRKLVIGARGEMLFPPGYYYYVGRARKNLRQRIARHIREDKKMRWHIDYFLVEASVESVYLITHLDECGIAFDLNSHDCMSTVFGFGSSDCSCGGHLLHSSIPLDIRASSLQKKYQFLPATGKS